MQVLTSSQIRKHDKKVENSIQDLIDHELEHDFRTQLPYHSMTGCRFESFDDIFKHERLPYELYTDTFYPESSCRYQLSLAMPRCSTTRLRHNERYLARSRLHRASYPSILPTQSICSGLSTYITFPHLMDIMGAK